MVSPRPTSTLVVPSRERILNVIYRMNGLKKRTRNLNHQTNELNCDLLEPRDGDGLLKSNYKWRRYPSHAFQRLSRKKNSGPRVANRSH
jgi:hypothetical protein